MPPQKLSTTTAVMPPQNQKKKLPRALLALVRLRRVAWARAKRRGWADIWRASTRRATPANVAAYTRAVYARPVAHRLAMVSFLRGRGERAKLRYAFACPTPAALRLLGTLRGLTAGDPCAGSGLWAATLRAVGFRRVDAVDADPPATASGVVRGDGPSAVRGQDVLLLCWPPFSEGGGDCVAARALARFRGDVVLHVGELQPAAGHVAGGQRSPQTGSSAFRAALARDFVLAGRARVARTPYARDELTAWRRREGG